MRDASAVRDANVAFARAPSSAQPAAAMEIEQLPLVVEVPYRSQRPVRRRGTVFPDRFHQEIITTRNHARRTLDDVPKRQRA